MAGTTASPNYNDLSFNLDFGKSKLGSFSLFGIVENSGEDIEDDQDLFADKDEDAYAKSRFNAFGLKHTINIGDKSYLKQQLVLHHQIILAKHCVIMILKLQKKQDSNLQILPILKVDLHFPRYSPQKFQKNLF